MCSLIAELVVSGYCVQGKFTRTQETFRHIFWMEKNLQRPSRHEKIL